ncbi:MAG TPA: Fe-S cluster assembly protein SufD [Opitutaceae bacterium]|jgi:Fe-S cluster assembly protein SufD
MSTAAPSVDAPSVGDFTAERFQRHLAELKGAPDWWVTRKRAAYEKFASLPMPRRTDESWRFSTLTGLSLAAPESAPAASVELPTLHDVATTARLSFIGNRLHQSSGLPAELVAKGVIVTSFSDAARHERDLVEAHFMAQAQRLGSEKFAALHAAFLSDGAFVFVPKGVELTDPIVVGHAANGQAAFPHTLVVLEENASATVIDLFGGETPLAIGANDLYAGHGSRLTYIGVQNWAPSALSFQLNSTLARRDTRVQSLNLHLGGRQSRHESLSQLQAPGAFSEMLALTVAREKQEFDQRTLQVHQAPNTKSDLLYKNALLDSAKTIFSGLIIVDPDAQKTDAYQSNRNLVLSENAEANSLPGLEIQANDVRCTHGATTSRLDPEQMFYLRARGIPPAAAQQILVFGFFEEVLNRLAHEGIHAALRGLIEAKFRE